MTTPQKFSLKDHLFNRDRVKYLAGLFAAADSAFDPRRFVRETVAEFPKLELKQRIAHIASVFKNYLDSDFRVAAKQITTALPPPLDPSKTDPAVVIKTLKDWQGVAQQNSVELKWMTARSLRTLVKQGDGSALKLLGFREQPKIVVSPIELKKASVAPGEAIEFEVELTAKRDERLMIDYVIEFVKANGKTTEKVFKIKQLEIAKGRTQTISKRHPFRADATTFTLYPGAHRITLQVNGKRYSSSTFEMKTDRS